MSQSHARPMGRSRSRAAGRSSSSFLAFLSFFFHQNGGFLEESRVSGMDFHIFSGISRAFRSIRRSPGDFEQCPYAQPFTRCSRHHRALLQILEKEDVRQLKAIWRPLRAPKRPCKGGL